MRQLKVLHIPNNVGGNPQGISRFLNHLGVRSTTWTLVSSYFQYPVDKVLCRQPSNIFKREFCRLIALRYVFLSDVVFFNFGQTLFQQLPSKVYSESNPLRFFLYQLYRFYAFLMQRLELFLLVIQNKTLLVQFQGDDARQGDFILANYSINTAQNVDAHYYSKNTDKLKRDQIKLLSSVCFKSYALNPDLLNVLPQGSEFLPYSHIALDDWAPIYTQLSSSPLRIGHAPSHRGFKGTDLILEAVDKLHREGLDFELILIEGLSNIEAKELYKSVDVLVDQLFAGWYGGLAVELMALGKPVIVYLRDEDLHFLPSEMINELPFIRSQPNDIYHVLRSVIQMPREDLFSLAQASRSFVERWHNPLTIAERIKSDIYLAASS